MTNNSEEQHSRTLWMGDIDGGVDERFLWSFFLPDEVISVRIVRSKLPGQSNYGYVEFVSRGVAKRVLQTYNGILIPGTQKIYNLKRAEFGIRDFDAGYGHSIFIGGLAPDVSDCLLKETFQAKNLSVGAAKVVVDPQTKQSKGFGFVKFMNEVERDRAMSEMNGVFCSGKLMRISSAIRKGANTAADKSLSPYTTPACQLNGNYNGSGLGYYAYAYGATEDTSLHAYGGGGQCPQQARYLRT
ncbi:hypothetical protein GIB67_037957 [Kingdonia uniflora]|uniref:RRM domain-containing protein n=1 Tax=Kingdonia uniflora TaxID=39325 RepID=A0A7J7LHH0_9MAGN|nr:hypothetical protein GIB67_037957 [Kingdonia uniflora]